MALTTFAGAQSGASWPRPIAKAAVTAVAGRPFSTWASGGNPGAGAFDTTLNGVTLSSSSSNVAGQLSFTDPASGSTYLSAAKLTASAAGQIIIADRIWHNGGYTITSTAAQNSTTPTWPARDNAAATSGDGIFLGLEISANAGAAAPTITVSYTNQSGTSGRTATNWFATANSPGVGAFFPIGLQAGDTGVQSVQSLTLSASWISGTMNLVAYRVLAIIDVSALGVSNAIDPLTGGFQKMYAGSVPFIISVPSLSTGTGIFGSVQWSQG